MPNDAKIMFGNALAKPFLIRSLHDAVHLIAKASFKKLTPGAVNERLAAASKLAEKVQELAIPLVKAFCSTFDQKYKTDVNSSKVTDATAALNNGDYHKCLGLLIHASKIGDGTPADVLMHLERLKKAFPDSTGDDSFPRLLSCDGSGVMLLNLASKYTVSEVEKDSDIFATGKLHDKVENDMRGTISLVGHHAAIAYGEAKSSFPGLGKAKTPLVVRARFLKTAIEAIFPKTFKEFTLAAHVFVPLHSVEHVTQQPANEVIGNGGGDVSIYIHCTGRGVSTKHLLSSLIVAPRWRKVAVLYCSTC